MEALFGLPFMALFGIVVGIIVAVILVVCLICRRVERLFDRLFPPKEKKQQNTRRASVAPRSSKAPSKATASLDPEDNTRVRFSELPMLPGEMEAHAEGL